MLYLSLLRFTKNWEIVELFDILRTRLYMLLVSETIENDNQQRMQLSEDEDVLFVD